MKLEIQDKDGFKLLQKTLGISEDGEIPPLHEELQEALVEPPLVMRSMIQHPLVHTMYFPVSNGMYNRQLEQKREMIKRYETEGKWESIVFMHERPYRLQALLEYGYETDDDQFWQIAS